MLRTRYVKSPEAVARLQAAMAEPAFLRARTLAIAFETDPDVVNELLPPPLEPAEQPTATVSVYEIGESNCVGPFKGASLNLSCRYRGEPGFYCVTMPMSTDTAVIFGRELCAEPKKLAEIVLDYGRTSHIRGTVTRHGVTYIDLRGTFEGEPQEIAQSGVSHHYYFKFMPSADGRGFAHEPELVRVTHTGHPHRLVRGGGTIIFRESAHDPVIDIPVLSVLGASYSEGETHTRAEVVQTVAAADFLPYAFAKMDDLATWLVPATTPA
ncbi:MAG: acetoacetate decarboxylase family protein [Dehalococcoidia bacterium]|nr:acetoacetate decarboxylase family protein [Dehalococcoidia bacterium]